MSDRTVPGGLLLASVAASAVALVAVALEVPGLRADGLLEVAAPLRGWPSLWRAALACVVPGAALLWLVQRVEVGKLAAARLAWLAWPVSFALVLALAAAGPEGVFALPRRVVYDGYLTDAWRFGSLAELWGSYSDRAAELSPHGVTHPPGPAAFFAAVGALAGPLAGALSALGLDAAYSSAASFRFAVETSLAALVVAALGTAWIVPAFHLARRLHGERAGVLAVALGATLPAALLVPPAVDALFPLLAVSAAALLARGLDARAPAPSALAGALVGVACLGSFGNLALAAWLVAFALWRDPRGARRHAAAGAAAFLAVWALAGLLGFDAVERVRGVFGHHYRGVNAIRPYAASLWGSPYAFLLWCGMPAAVGLLAALRRDAAARATVSVLVLLTLSGIARGETERLWLALAPLVVVPAAGAHAAGSGDRGADEQGAKRNARGGSPPRALILIGLLHVAVLAAWTGQYP